MRSIDADALKTPIEDRIDNIPASEYDNGWNNAIYAVIDEIDNAPTVEYPFYQEAYQTGYEEGKNERPQVNVIPQECIKILADDKREWSCAECKAEHEDLLSWLKHYAQIRQIVHNWSCDYPPVNPEHKLKHTKEEYFDMIIDTFAVEGEGYGYPQDV